jgi:hypothetical protein
VTVVGNPQNMIIALAAPVPYLSLPVPLSPWKDKFRVLDGDADRQTGSAA